MKKVKKIISPAQINDMREELEKKEIPLERLVFSPAYRRYMEKVAYYITGRDIRVEFSKEIDTAFTDNRRIVINPLMKIPDESFMSRTKVNLGVEAHEIFHILFSDFSVLTRINDYKGRRKLLQVVNNILEDSFIEYVGCQIYAGDFRAAILYTRFMIMELYDELEKVEQDTNKLISALSHYGSCGMLKGNLNEETQKIWEKIVPLFDKGRMELDARKRFDIAVEITKLIEPVADKDSIAYPELPESVFGDHSESKTSPKDRMSKEEIRKALSEMDIHDLIEKAKEMLEKASGEEGEEAPDESSEGGLKIGVKGPKKDSDKPGSEGTGETPDILIDLSGEENEASGKGSGEDGPIVIKPDSKTGEKGEKKDAKDSGEGEGKGSSGDSRDEIGEKGGLETPGSKEDKGGGGTHLESASAGEEADRELRIAAREKALKDMEEAKALEAEKYEKLMADIEKDYLADELEVAVEDEKTKIFNKAAKGVDYGIKHRGCNNTIVAMPYGHEAQKAQYNAIVAKHQDVINQTVRRMKKILKQSVEENFTRQRMGNFDVRQTEELFREGKVFQRTKESTGQDIVFTVLVDESGSMSSYSNYENAKKAAIVFKEICDALNVPVLIMGFTAYGMNNPHHRIFTNFQSPRDTRYSLTNISALANNRDGYSIRFAGEVMNKFYPDASKVLIVISDGEPADNGYGGVAAQMDTKHHVDYIEKKLNTPVVAVNICNRRHIHDGMFKHIVEVPKFSELPEKLVNLLKKEFKKML